LHCSPLHILAFVYDIKPDNYEEIKTVRSKPQYENKFHMAIDGTAEESIDRDRECNADVQIYADGSGLDGKAGAAAVIYWGIHPPKTLRFYLGPLTEHTTFEAEAVGVLLGLHMLSYEKDILTAHISIDNQAIIQALSARKPKAGKHIIEEAI
jgi:hypothetical protein